jgi:hypothetical protein
MNSWVVPGRYDFSIPEAQRLSDLAGVDVDLEATLRICERCDRLMDEHGTPAEGDALLWLDNLQALGDLMFAAVVRYGRTSNSGVRKGIPQEWLNSLPDGLLVSVLEA